MRQNLRLDREKKNSQGSRGFGTNNNNNDNNTLHKRKASASIELRDDAMIGIAGNNSNEKSRKNDSSRHKKRKRQSLIRSFQLNVLNLDWLPTSTQLQNVGNNELKIELAPLHSNDGGNISNKFDATTNSRKENIAGQNLNNLNSNKTCSINPEWLYDYSKHLYLKYIKEGADLCVNIAHETRVPLNSIFLTYRSDAEAMEALKDTVFTKLVSFLSVFVHVLVVGLVYVCFSCLHSTLFCELKIVFWFVCKHCIVLF